MERCVFCQGELDLTTRRCRECQRMQPGAFPAAVSPSLPEEPGGFRLSPDQENVSGELAPLRLEGAESARRHLSRRTLLLGLVALAGIGLSGSLLGRILWILAHQQAHYTYLGHEGEAKIDALAWSPDSQRIVSGALSLQVWDALSGKHVYIFPDRKGINAAAFSPDGQYLVAGFWDLTAAVWEVATDRKLLTYRGHLQTDSLAGLPSLSVAGNQHSRILGPAAVVRPGVDGLAWSPDGTLVLSSGGDGTTQVWEALTGKQLLRFGSTLDFATSASWSPDGAHLLMWTRRGIELHDATTGVLLGTYPIGSDTVSGPLAYSPDGKYLATLDDQKIHLWEITTGQQVLTYQGHSDTVRCVVWSPDSKRLASAGFDLIVQVWGANDGQTEYSYRGHLGFWQRFFSIQSPEDASQMPHTTLTASHLHGGVHARQVGLLPQDTGTRPYISALAWAPNGRYIASGGSDATVQVWQPG